MPDADAIGRAAIDVAICGAGIAGLAAAYELQTRGLSFIVLERAGRAGGVIVNEEVDGFTIDAGPDALLTQKKDGIQLCEALGLGPRLVAAKRPRTAFIQRGGALHPLPAGSVLGFPTAFLPFLTSKLFSWPGKLRMGAEVLVPARRGSSRDESSKDESTDESIGHFIERRFGREAVDYLAEPLLAGIHAGDVYRLSARSMFPRFVEAERKDGSLIRAFRSQASHAPPSTDGPFRSLPGGLSEIVRALVAALPASSLQVGNGVASISRSTDGTLRVRTDRGPAIDARAVILSTPAYVAGSIIGGLDADLARLCADVPYASTGTIALAFKRDQIAHPLDGSGFVVPKAEAKSKGILAASWLSSKWPGRAPDDRVLMRTFVGGARDPEALADSDSALVARSLAALSPLVGISGEPILSRVYRFERASAQHEVGHAARLSRIEQALARLPGVFVTGSGFRGVGIPDCVADARSTATQVSEFLVSEPQRRGR